MRTYKITWTSADGQGTEEGHIAAENTAEAISQARQERLAQGGEDAGTFDAEICVKVRPVGRMDLFLEFPQQTRPQRPFIDIHPAEQEVRAGVGLDGVSMDVWHGQTIRIYAPYYLAGDSLTDRLQGDRCQALIRAICNGHSEKWDGSDWSGYMDSNAVEAAEELEGIINSDSEWGEEDFVRVWAARDWLINDVSADLGLYPYMDTAEIERLAEEILAEAKESGDADLIEGLEEELRERVQELEEELEAQQD